MIIPVETALRALREAGTIFTEVFSRGGLSVEIYKPQGADLQTPHERDEIYVVISGTGTFNLAGERRECGQGDLLFVPAHVEHRFEKFSDDFVTWVIFYGPLDGEKGLFTR